MLAGFAQRYASYVRGDSVLGSVITFALLISTPTADSWFKEVSM